MSYPLVTIGITCFNAEKTICRAINSAIQQSWPNIEIVIVDDGSIDNSVELINAVADKDERIRLIRHGTNNGTAVTRTSLINNTRGEFLVFFDDDDESSPERVTKQVNRIRKYEDVSGERLIACYTSRLIVNKNTNETYVPAIGISGPVPHGKVVLDYLFYGFSQEGYEFGEMGSGTLMARTSVFREVGDFDKRFRRCAEWDWAVRLALLNGHFIGCAEPLIRQHITRTKDKSSRRPLYYGLLLRRKHHNYLKQRGIYIYSLIYAHAKFYYARGYTVRFRLILILLFLLKPADTWSQWRLARSKRKFNNW